MNNIHQMQRLQEAAKTNGPLCVGLDTDPSYIPENILSKYKTPMKAVKKCETIKVKHVDIEEGMRKYVESYASKR